MKTQPRPGKKTIKSADRALEIYEYLVTTGSEVGARDIERILRIPKSPAQCYLRTLLERGLLEQNPNNRKYSVTNTTKRRFHGEKSVVGVGLHICDRRSEASLKATLRYEKCIGYCTNCGRQTWHSIP